MNDRSLKLLEFYHLLDILKEYSTSPLGRKRCEALRPAKNLPSIQSRLIEVMELKRILETEGEIPLGGLKDTEGILNKLDIEGSVLDVRELLDPLNCTSAPCPPIVTTGMAVVRENVEKEAGSPLAG